MPYNPKSLNNLTSTKGIKAGGRPPNSLNTSTKYAQTLRQILNDSTNSQYFNKDEIRGILDLLSDILIKKVAPVKKKLDANGKPVKDDNGNFIMELDYDKIDEKSVFKLIDVLEKHNSPQVAIQINNNGRGGGATTINSEHGYNGEEEEEEEALPWGGFEIEVIPVKRDFSYYVSKVKEQEESIKLSKEKKVKDAEYNENV